MSNPRYWWYSDVKRAVLHSPKFRNNPRPEYQRYIEAIDKALADVDEMKDAKERRYAIDEILFKQTRTIDGVALKLHYSSRVIQGWINDFINLVGEYKGFEEMKNK